MTDERKQLSKPKKFGYVLLFAVLCSFSAVALDFIFEILPFTQTDTTVSTPYYAENIKTFLMIANNDKPLFYPVAFIFAFICAFLMYQLCKKREFSPWLFLISLSLSLSVSLFIAFLERSFGILFMTVIVSVSVLLWTLFLLLPKMSAPPTKRKLAIYSALIFALSVGTYFSSNAYIKNSMKGEVDKTNSWSAINQTVKKTDNWKQIVKSTPFDFEKIEKTKGEIGSDEYYVKICNYPCLDGSTVCVPMAAEFARQHLGLTDEQCKNFVDFSTTHYAYEYLIGRSNLSRTYYTPFDQPIYVNFPTTDLILATEPSDEELASAKAEGITLVKKPICYDAFVFITHKDNPVESLTVKQIQDIYSGKIKNWKEVGGKDEKIRAFQREKNSGSQTAMENLVMQGTNMIDPIEVTVIEGMGELVDRVAEYQNGTASLGYTYKYYIDTLYKNENIKTIAVEGIEPTDSNIRAEKYPFWTNYYGVIRGGDEDKTGGKFLDWILSKEGQKCVKQAGYITLK